MQVSSSGSSLGAQSLQMLKAQQAWEARRTGQTKPAEVQAASPQSRKKIETANPTPAAATSPAPISPQWNNTVREVQEIAQKAGFVGVTEQDIRRAYTQGESLLADYRV